MILERKYSGENILLGWNYYKEGKDIAKNLSLRKNRWWKLYSEKGKSDPDKE